MTEPELLGKSLAALLQDGQQKRDQTDIQPILHAYQTLHLIIETAYGTHRAEEHVPSMALSIGERKIWRPDIYVRFEKDLTITASAELTFFPPPRSFRQSPKYVTGNRAIIHVPQERALRDEMTIHGEWRSSAGERWAEWPAIPLEEHLRRLIPQHSRELELYAGLPFMILDGLFKSHRNRRESTLRVQESMAQATRCFYETIRQELFRQLDDASLPLFLSSLNHDEKIEFFRSLILTAPDKQLQRIGTLLEGNEATKKLIAAAARPLLAEKTLEGKSP